MSSIVFWLSFQITLRNMFCNTVSNHGDKYTRYSLGSGNTSSNPTSASMLFMFVESSIGEHDKFTSLIIFSIMLCSLIHIYILELWNRW